MSGITISPKHGVNPSILMCFWCGEDMGITLNGRLKGDVQAPPKVFGTYEPCEKCKEAFAQGILAVGVKDTPVIEGLQPICKDNGVDMYPDGSHVVFTEQGIAHFLDDQDMIDAAIKHKAIFMPAEIVHQVVEDANKLVEEENDYEDLNGGASAD